MAVVEVTVLPLGTGNTSLGGFVAACQRELQQCGAGLKFELTAMGTIMEGDLERTLEVARRLHEVSFNHGAARVYTTIHIDDRRDKAGTIAGKVKSVQKKLAEQESNEQLSGD